MAKITLVKGDIQIKELTDNYVVVEDIYNQNQFLIRNIDNEYPHKVIEVFTNSPSLSALQWIAANSIYPVIMCFASGNIPAGLNKTGLKNEGYKKVTNEIEIVDGSVPVKKITPYDVATQILTNPDRNEVFKLVNDNYGLQFMIVRILMSSTDLIGPENAYTVSLIDMLSLFRSTTATSEFLAYCIKPVASRIRYGQLKYLFPKKADAEKAKVEETVDESEN